MKTKKLLAVILATVLLFSTAFSISANADFYIFDPLTLGDANSDGITNIKDLVRIKTIIAEINLVTSSADINGDSFVANDDLVLLAKYIVCGKNGMEAYYVTFKDSDGTVLETVYVPKHFKAQPTVIPTADAKGNAFEGWDASLSNITSNIVVNAVYKKTGGNEGAVPPDWDYGD